MDAGVPVVIVQEQDPARGALPFRCFFEQTPADLVERHLFNALAVPLYPHPEHRVVSLRQLARLMGAGGTAPVRECVPLRAAAAWVRGLGQRSGLPLGRRRSSGIEAGGGPLRLGDGRPDLGDHSSAGLRGVGYWARATEHLRRRGASPAERSSRSSRPRSLRTWWRTAKFSVETEAGDSAIVTTDESTAAEAV